MKKGRRLFLAVLSLTGLATVFGWWRLRSAGPTEPSSNGSNERGDGVILEKFKLDFQWPVVEPFLFCVHHYDHYPKGNPRFAPEASLLEGRNMGQDFVEKNGFRMYHGMEVPGFPVHPHRGFETVTIVRKGYVDHADSMGAAGRYGQGDVQWMTAGSGVQHSEMFPLLKQTEENTVELFQIWLNLPRRSKMVSAHFKMFWAEDIPKLNFDENRVKVNLIAGRLGEVEALAPPPDSWAGDPKNEVQIALIKFDAGGTYSLPASQTVTNRTIYFFAGEGLEVDGQRISPKTGMVLDSQKPTKLFAKTGGVEILLLQAKPIGEPIFQHGPFVMNTREEIISTIDDYRRTEFGGWSWPRNDMVHGPQIERFAKYPDGRIEKPKV